LNSSKKFEHRVESINT